MLLFFFRLYPERNIAPNEKFLCDSQSDTKLNHSKDNSLSFNLNCRCYLHLNSFELCSLIHAMANLMKAFNVDRTLSFIT